MLDHVPCAPICRLPIGAPNGDLTPLASQSGLRPLYQPDGAPNPIACRDERFRRNLNAAAVLDKKGAAQL
jgi:hypothetical protein